MSISPNGGSWEKTLDNDAIWKGSKIFVPLEARGILTNIYQWTHFQSQGQ